MEALLTQPETGRALGLINVTSLDHMVRIFKAGPAAIADYLAGSPTLSDDRPQLEYFESLPQAPLRVSGVSSPPETVFVP